MYIIKCIGDYFVVNLKVEHRYQLQLCCWHCHCHVLYAQSTLITACTVVQAAVSYKLLYKPMVLGIGNGKFRPHTVQNHSTDFDETWNLELSPEDHPACKTTYRCVNMGGLVCTFLSSPFLFTGRICPKGNSASIVFTLWPIFLGFSPLRGDTLHRSRSNLAVRP